MKMVPTVALAGLAAVAIPANTAAAPVDSLAIPMARDSSSELWPLELSIAIASRAGRDAPLPAQTLVVSDGHTLRLDRTVLGPRGQQTFELTVVARNHPGQAVELEWDLRVFQAPYELPENWRGLGRYLLHRVDLAPPPRLGGDRLRIARSDIVSTTGAPYREVFEIDGQRYEIRLFGRSLRG